MRNYKELFVAVFSAGAIFILGAAAVRPWEGSAKATICRDNLKKIHTAQAQYVAENGGYFPQQLQRVKPRWRYWSFLVAPYLKTPRTLSCPESPKGAKAYEQNDLLPAQYSDFLISYGMNYYLSYPGTGKPDFWPGKPELVKRPEYVINYGDSKTQQLRPTTSWENDYNPVHQNYSFFISVAGNMLDLEEKEIGLVTPHKKWKWDARRWQNWKK